MRGSAKPEPVVNDYPRQQRYVHAGRCGSRGDAASVRKRPQAQLLLADLPQPGEAVRLDDQ
ncbi:MAG TPA: hypothetical protein DEG70_03855, partial [Chloroflexi bacterium]|nr:hypothetical protein [Chloroflexota bacterium]